MDDTFNFSDVIFAAGPVDITDVWSADPNGYVATSFDEDAHIIFTKLSGETHILNFFTYAMLQQLCFNSMNFNQLWAHMREYFDLSEDECGGALICNALNSLDEAGLISKKMAS